jgi:hypothetical protein
MLEVERRQAWSRIVGVERRGAPIATLLGHSLPDPTHLMDEDFAEPPASGKDKEECVEPGKVHF